jgi:hypothetical protein
VRRTGLGALASAIVLAGGTAAAQSPASPARVEIGIGPLWMGGHRLGSSDATETTSSGSSFRLFSSSAKLSSGRAAEARIGVRLTRAIAVEASAAYGSMPLAISISNDTENGAPVTATERIQQVTAGVGVLWYVGRRRAVPSRAAPFVSAEAGYMRQLHESLTLVEAGHVFQVGGGMKYSLLSRSRGSLKGAGIRVDARALLRSKGVAFDNRTHASLALGASLFIRF